MPQRRTFCEQRGTKENCDVLRNTAPVSEILLIVNRKQVSATV